MEYPCITFQQRPEQDTIRFCLFEAPVKDILEWSSVPRLSHDKKDGVQRQKSDFRVKGIAKFLSQEARNTIPTALVIAFSKDSYQLKTDPAGQQLIVLNADKKDEVFVIDGQHRLYGMHAFNPNARAPVVGILDASNDEKAFQFIVINNKAAKVAPDHIRALTFAYSNHELEPRLRTAKLSLSKNVLFVQIANEADDSPFKGQVSLPSVEEGQRWVNASAIESSIAYIHAKKIAGLDDDETIASFFLAIWKAIKESWPDLFAAESRLLTKVGMITMTRYIVDAIDLMAGLLEDIDLSNEEDVILSTKRILKMQTPDFWKSDWTVAVSDSKVVRDTIFEALRRVQQNIKQGANWFDDVPLILVPSQG